MGVRGATSRRRAAVTLVAATISVGLAGCASDGDLPVLPSSGNYGSQTTDPSKYDYIIGPGDSVQIFVWRNPEVSQSVTVRPDGKITTPLVEDLQASGKTPTQLARDIEKVLETYIRQPIVTVIMGGFLGPYSEQIRVVGEASKPQALPYREKMTLLDVMIAVGGLTQFADGNHAKIVRIVDGKQTQYEVHIDDLLKDGNINANVDMLPGDILIVPESWL
ncbi:XrtA/PEP-CTERM system exopolysaccharide export protein [Plasticicumulans acidivorans]|uniref:Polysaccharide export outer membrane protein n=1 Tax=Plasticicumulans acidivorans TaxID=886464 RepID=A0A317MZI2_9GAMM|nr:XrtA/PEP-CTERM system exopolysaccharide export protein [Plasticicumulans acidivorans]PWV65731.1 polysaccharide export outer membrane protein [Plasticicumulans acidivorans]